MRRVLLGVSLISVAIGAALGAFAHMKLTGPPDPWGDTEEAMLTRMQGFQVRLNTLEQAAPDSIEALSKQMEAQNGIAAILIKYREATQAKWAPYVGAAGTTAAAMITALLGFLAARLGSKIKRAGD